MCVCDRNDANCVGACESFRVHLIVLVGLASWSWSWPGQSSLVIDANRLSYHVREGADFKVKLAIGQAFRAFLRAV